eukprot:TRINITY_DN301_c0_g1_i1.p1 TRINITY_DN301_c0_g1~~TRINITY_DN301_c0_g1_i1.p1  ORF type:complete len:152 (-),score=34.55 TRINITY_DN301_c0_g1_i1:197-652(-)
MHKKEIIRSFEKQIEKNSEENNNSIMDKPNDIIIREDNKIDALVNEIEREIQMENKLKEENKINVEDSKEKKKDADKKIQHKKNASKSKRKEEDNATGEKHKIACKNCSRLHHRCDKLFPTCTYCKRKGLTCEINQSKTRGRPHGTTKGRK